MIPSVTYGLIYTVPFKSIKDNSFLIEIYKRDYVGNSTELTGSVSPFVITIEDADFIYEPLRFSKATAATGEMAAKSTAAYAGFPFVGVGLAAAAIAAMVAIIPKFKDGGIVGGTSYHGDKILARVNSGELILNRQQQSTLFGLMNQNSISKSGDNKVIVRGSDLILSINNELKHRNKKPIL